MRGVMGGGERGHGSSNLVRGCSVLSAMWLDLKSVLSPRKVVLAQQPIATKTWFMHEHTCTSMHTV